MLWWSEMIGTGMFLGVLEAPGAPSFNWPSKLVMLPIKDHIIPIWSVLINLKRCWSVGMGGKSPFWKTSQANVLLPSREWTIPPLVRPFVHIFPLKCVFCSVNSQLAMFEDTGPEYWCSTSVCERNLLLKMPLLSHGNCISYWIKRLNVTNLGWSF